MSLGIGVSLYLIINRICQYYFQINSMYHTKKILELPDAIRNAYITFNEVLFQNYYGMNPYNSLQWTYRVCVILAIILVLQTVIREKQITIWRKVAGLGLTLCVPIAINFIYVITLNHVTIHSLMVYSICFIPIIPCVFFEWFHENNQSARVNSLLSWILCITLSLNVFLNCKVDNIAYQSAYFAQKEAISYYTNLITRMQSMEDYNTDLPVAFVNLNDIDDSTMYHVSFGTHLTALEFDMRSVIKSWTYQYFIEYHCGFKPIWASEAQKQELQSNEQVKNMPCYPNAGSIQVVNDILVVKFADSE